MRLRAERYKKSDIIPPSPSLVLRALLTATLRVVISVLFRQDLHHSYRLREISLRAFHHGFKTAFDFLIYVIDLHEVERLHSEHRCLFEPVFCVSIPTGRVGMRNMVLFCMSIPTGRVGEHGTILCEHPHRSRWDGEHDTILYEHPHREHDTILYEHPHLRSH